MGGVEQPVLIRGDVPQGDALAGRLEALDGDDLEELLLALEAMEYASISPADEIEVLDGRYGTYALGLGEVPLVLLCTFDRDRAEWTLLDLVACGSVNPDGVAKAARRAGGDVVAPDQIAERAYQAACQAHGLANPTRY